MEPKETGDGWALRAAAVALVFASFVCDSFARYPVPAPNEPHYLAKAKHYWNPAWCAHDFFLESSNSHIVFYQTFGQLTRVASLETTAIVGRLVGLAILAVGWMAFVRAIVPGFWPAVWAAWIDLALAAIGNLSGEWLVGGIEAKVPAYGLLFLAIGIVLEGSRVRGSTSRTWRLPFAGLLAGLAVSFHPVVGIWGLMAAGFATAVVARGERQTQPAKDSLNFRSRWPILIAAALLVIAAAPGVIGALGAATGASAAADYIQVYYRLAHHLDPLHFLPQAWGLYAALTAFWLISRRWLSKSETERWFFWYVVGSALFALGGLIVGARHGPPEHMIWYGLRWKLLKFYPFRLVDALIPLACAISVVALAKRWCGNRARRFAIASVLFVVPVFVACMSLAPDARPPFTDAQRADWIDACRYLSEHTPAQTVVLTPTQESWAFKWYANRAEFVSYKDCPQDGKGILEWNDRLLFIREWAEQHFDGGYTRAETALLSDRGIDYILSKRLGPFDFDPIYRNGTFRIYHLQKERAP